MVRGPLSVVRRTSSGAFRYSAGTPEYTTAIFSRGSVRAPEPVHGKPVEVRHDGKTIFEGIDGNFTAGRYHSLVVDRESIPDCLEISAESPDGLVMGMRHRSLPIEGVQFHPESILTEHGKTMLRNFLSL